MKGPERRWVPQGLDRLPEGWRWVPVQSVVEIDPRVSRPPSGTRVTVVPMGALDSAAGRIEGPESISVDAAGSHLRAFQTGDVLLAKISPSFENGKVAVAAGLDSPVGLGSSEFHVLRPSEELLAEYLWLILRQDRVRADLVPTMSGRAGQQRIDSEALGLLAIPLPPTLAEQARIVDAAREVEEQCRSTLAHVAGAAAAAVDMRSAVLADATFSGAPWERKRLADLVPDDRPVRYGIVQPGPEHPGGVPYIRVRDFDRGSISLEGVGHTDPAIAKRYQNAVLRAGDLLISIRGTIGELAQVPDELDGAHTTQDAARISGLEPTLREWLVLIIASPAGQRWLSEHTRGRAVQGVSITDLRTMEIPVPPIEEMGRRVDLARRALAAVEEVEVAIGRSDEMTSRIRETSLLAVSLGHQQISDLPLLSPSEPVAVAEPRLLEDTPVPIRAPDSAPLIVHAIAAAGGQVEATELLAQQKTMEPDDFYLQLWEAVDDGWLKEPPRGSSILELDDAP